MSLILECIIIWCDIYWFFILNKEFETESKLRAKIIDYFLLNEIVQLLQCEVIVALELIFWLKLSSHEEFSLPKCQKNCIFRSDNFQPKQLLETILLSTQNLCLNR